MIIPENYIQDMKSLLTMFHKENNLVPKIRGQELGPEEFRLSKKGEAVIDILANRLNPEKINLTDYLDIELFLRAFYKVYMDRATAYLSGAQADYIVIRVKGLIQSYLSPETAKLYCAGLEKVANAISDGIEPEMKKEAMGLKLEHYDRQNNYIDYYSSCQSNFALGVNAYCGTDGYLWQLRGSNNIYFCWGDDLEVVCLAKDTRFRNLVPQLQQLISIINDDLFWKDKSDATSKIHGIEEMQNICSNPNLSDKQKEEKIKTVAARPEREGLFHGKRNDVTKEFYRSVIEGTVDIFYKTTYEEGKAASQAKPKNENCIVM